jgi:hypothetical protein
VSVDFSVVWRVWSHIKTHRHRSSITLTMERIPFWLSFGVGAPASDPSPRKSGPSSDLEICAASRIVKGRTRTATLIEEAPSGTGMVVLSYRVVFRVSCRVVLCLYTVALPQVTVMRDRISWATPCVDEGRGLRLSMIMKRRMCGSQGVSYGVRDGMQ